MRPTLLDLCCKAGDAARGYQQAGFYVVGVDIATQPNYAGDEFIQADALAELAAAIPPAYTEWIGARLLNALTLTTEAAS